MSNRITRLASGAFDVVLFGAGLADGAVRAIVHHVRRRTSPAASTPAPAPEARKPTPTPREVPRPRAPEWQPDPDDIGVETPVGTTGAAPAYNPDTAESDLQQRGTEQIMEPSTTKRIKSESDMLRRAAERNPD